MTLTARTHTQEFELSSLTWISPRRYNRRRCPTSFRLTCTLEMLTVVNVYMYICIDMYIYVYICSYAIVIACDLEETNGFVWAIDVCVRMRVRCVCDNFVLTDVLRASKERECH